MFRYLKKTKTLWLVLLVALRQCGAMSTQTGLAAQTLVILLRASYSCSTVQPSHGDQSISLLWLCPQLKPSLSLPLPSFRSLLQELISLRKFLANLGYPETEQTPVFADNETCVAWSEG